MKRLTFGFVAIWLFTVIVACGVPANDSNAENASESSGEMINIDLPLEATVISMVRAAMAGRYDVVANFTLPSLAVYAGDGRLVKQIEAVDDLATLTQLLDSAHTGKFDVSGNPMPLAVLEGVIREKNQAGSGFGDTSGKVTLVLWVSRDSCTDNCEKFKSAFNDIIKSDPDHYAAIRLSLAKSAEATN